MVNYLLKKSYQLKDLKEIVFKDLWGDHGVFTTMWIFDRPSKILFFKEHINNLIKSAKAYSVFKKSLKKDILNIIKENLNSIDSVSKLLKKYSDNIKLIAGDTNTVLKELDLQNIDFTFLDGGHSYQTVINDLTTLYGSMKDKKKVILCDDYGKESYIPEVEKAVNEFTKQNNLELNIIENRFAEIIT